MDAKKRDTLVTVTPTLGKKTIVHPKNALGIFILSVFLSNGERKLQSKNSKRNHRFYPKKGTTQQHHTHVYNGKTRAKNVTIQLQSSSFFSTLTFITEALVDILTGDLNACKRTYLKREREREREKKREGDGRKGAHTSCSIQHLHSVGEL